MQFLDRVTNLLAHTCTHTHTHTTHTHTHTHTLRTNTHTPHMHMHTHTTHAYAHTHTHTHTHTHIHTDTDGYVVLESLYYPGRHVGVRDDGEVKPPNETGKGRHAQFTPIVKGMDHVNRVRLQGYTSGKFGDQII